MIEINPNKIKKAEIVVGIPSYNEADNIANVVKVVDLGLRKYFKNKKAVLINVDNHSPDKTREVFLNTVTETPKIYISTPCGVKGKGNNLKNLFLKIQDLKAKAGATVDADLKSINPEWVKCLLGPIEKGYDYITPIYERHKYDGSITNHLCFPLIYGLLGYNIRQPIGGDTGFSAKMVRYWLKQEWTRPVRNFGIDIFMTLNAIKSKGKLGQVNLGSKIHKPSAPKLDKMFLEVGETLFQFLTENKTLWHEKAKIKKPPLVCRVKSRGEYPELKFKYQKDSLEIDSDAWAQKVYQLLSVYQTSPDEKVLKHLRAFYFARMISFIKETSNKTDQQAEKLIQKQAQQFYKKRNYLPR